MPGTTSKGYPYVLGTDSADTIDDTSLSLAQKLEAVVPFAMAAGTSTITVTSAASATVSVTFPPSRFTTAPIVIVGLANAPTGSTKLVARAQSIAAGGFTLAVYTGDGTTTTANAVQFTWWAVQMTSSQASG